MKIVVLALLSWLVTGLIVILGVSTGATIWFFMEPIVDSVPDPASYYLAVGAGVPALLLSAAVSVGLTIHAARCELSKRATTA